MSQQVYYTPDGVAHKETSNVPQTSRSSTSTRTKVQKPTFKAGNVIQYLPRDATPAQQDSIVQLYLPKQRVRVLSSRPDTLSLPGLPGKKAKFNSKAMPKVYEESFFAEKLRSMPNVTTSVAMGKTAQPMPYTLRNDDWVTSTLLVCFFLLTIVFSRGRHFLKRESKNFFHPVRHTNEEIKAETGLETYCRTFLVLQTCFLMGIFFFSLIQQYRPQAFGQFPPLMMLVATVFVSLFYITLKLLEYSVVNWIFFDKLKRKRWKRNYVYIVSLAGMMLFPLALLITYFDVKPQIIWIYLLFVFISSRILLFWKVFSIFFGKIHGILHLIVYFCALEITPLLVIWLAWKVVNNFWMIIF